MRLSNIDRIDEPGIPAVQWAYDRIHEERLTQGEILDELNSQLRQAGVPEVSRSGFNRYVQKVRMEGWQRPASVAKPPPRFDDPRQERILAALRKVEAAQAELRAAIEA